MSVKKNKVVREDVLYVDVSVGDVNLLDSVVDAYTDPNFALSEQGDGRFKKYVFAGEVTITPGLAVVEDVKD